MKPTALFHVQHFLGMGHLVRAFALAEALAVEFSVIVVTGGRFPAGIEQPRGVEVLALPSLGFDTDRQLVGIEPGTSVEELLIERERRLVEIHDETNPDVVLIELFPFGRKKLAGELLALLHRCRSRPFPPLTVTSVRDLLVTGRRDQQRHDDRAAAVADQLIDLVLVHGDRRFVTLEDSFRPTRSLSTPVEYTGFVSRRNPSTPPSITGSCGVIVSAGGGWVGGALMRAALDAAPLVAERHGLGTTLITGPLADESEAARLRSLAADLPMVSLIGSVPALQPMLAQSVVSVSQAGYNTVNDILQSAVPSVLVPYGDDRENEQPRRAARLAEHGLAVVLDSNHASGERLAEAISAAIAQPSTRPCWSMDGAERSASIIRARLATHRQRRAG